jgi:hypothetical protein
MITETRSSGAVSPPTDILAALRQASAKTGSDFEYLLGTAMRESSLKTQAKSATSSATGLFQFIDQTWLGLVKRFGANHGLGQYSDAIRETDNGHYAVASADTKSAILALRKDPSVASLMAGEAATETKEGMEATLGRQVSCGELYAAHFLGQGNACRLIASNASDPSQRADLLFPQAAKANRGIFYNADGTAKTVRQIYDWAIQLPDGTHKARSAPLGGEGLVAAGRAPATLRGASDVAPEFPATDGTHFWRSHSAGDDQSPSAGPRTMSSFHPVPHTFAVGSLPQTSALILTPGVIEILASLNAGTAFTPARRAD